MKNWKKNRQNVDNDNKADIETTEGLTGRSYTQKELEIFTGKNQEQPQVAPLIKPSIFSNRK